MRSLPGDLASSQRDVNAPYSTAAPAHTSAITTPQSVRKSVKGKVLRSVSNARYVSTARGAQRCYPRAGRREALPRRGSVAGGEGRKQREGRVMCPGASTASIEPWR